jgi:hypothetical protein
MSIISILICSESKVTDEWREFIPDIFIHEDLNLDLYENLVRRKNIMSSQLHSNRQDPGKIIIIIDVEKHNSTTSDYIDKLNDSNSIYCTIVCDISTAPPSTIIDKIYGSDELDNIEESQQKQREYSDALYKKWD